MLDVVGAVLTKDEVDFVLRSTFLDTVVDFSGRC